MKKRGIRRLFSVLLALVVIVGTINLPMNVKVAKADGSQQIGASSAYWEVIDGVLYITGSGDLPDYSAPYNQPWYSRSNSITSIIIDDGITRLGEKNFGGLDNVTSITVPDSVTSIGKQCFYDTGIESVVINGSNITINEDAFGYCKNLKNVSFSGEVHYDHNGAFFECKNLETVTFSSINRLGQLDFCRCPKLEKIVINNIPDGFTIDKRLFGDGVDGIPANLYIVIPDGKSIADLGISDLNLRSALCGKVVTQSQYDAWKVGDGKITQRNHDFDENTVFTKIDENTHQWTCSTCDGVAQGNHDFSNQPYVYAEPGKHQQKCKYCDATNKPVECSDPYRKKIYEVPATCGKAGWYDEGFFCKYCDEVYSGEHFEVPATGNHTWDSGKVTKKATLKATGKIIFTCKDCGNTKEETIAKLKSQKITVDKSVNKKVTVKAKNLTKNKNYNIKAKAKTAVSYKVTKTPKKGSKYITVTKKGKITLKKKAPKGTYEITITAKETDVYGKATKKVTIVVK